MLYQQLYSSCTCAGVFLTMMMMMPVVISGHTGKMKRSRQPFSAAFLLRKIQFFSGSNP